MITARVSIAGYKPHKVSDAGGYLIAAWNRSPYSHTEMLIDGACYSSSLRDGGVRSKVIDTSPSHWTVIPAPWVDLEHALAVFKAREGLPYGYFDLFAQHVLRLPVNGRGVLCSELCAEMAGLTRPYEWSPGALMDFAESRVRVGGGLNPW